MTMSAVVTRQVNQGDLVVPPEVGTAGPLVQKPPPLGGKWARKVRFGVFAPTESGQSGIRAHFVQGTRRTPTYAGRRSFFFTQMS